MRRFLLGSIMSLLACSAGSEVESVGQRAAAPPPRTFIATTDEGFVVIDGEGAVISTHRTKARVDHLAIDPFRGRLLTFETDDRDSGGHVIDRDLRALDVDTELAFLDGVARFHPAPFGVVVFEESYGTRWRLLGGHHATPAPMPLSVWSSASETRALVREEDETLALRTTSDGAEVASSAVDPSAPFVRGLALGFEAIADARTLDAERIVLLVDHPPRLIVASASRTWAFDLDDAVRLDPLTRGLVVVDPGYVLVGTERTVRAFRVGEETIESLFLNRTAHAPIDGPL